MNKFDWSRITAYDYSHLPWSPTAPTGRSGHQQQQQNYTTWSKTYYPAPGQSYRRDVIYWPSGVTPPHSKSTKSYAASSITGGDQRQPWNSSPSSLGAAVPIDIGSISHKRQFPELKAKSQLFGSSSSEGSHHGQYQNHISIPKQSSDQTPSQSPTSPQQPSSPSFMDSLNNNEENDQQYNKRPYRNNSSGVAACLSYPSYQQPQDNSNKKRSPRYW